MACARCSIHGRRRHDGAGIFACMVRGQARRSRAGTADAHRRRMDPCRAPAGRGQCDAVSPEVQSQPIPQWPPACPLRAHRSWHIGERGGRGDGDCGRDVRRARRRVSSAGHSGMGYVRGVLNAVGSRIQVDLAGAQGYCQGFTDAPAPMIDLHCHLLPGIDDGATTVRDSLEMARIAAADGITLTACTPHIYPGMYENTSASIRDAITALEAELTAAGIALALTIGADAHL